MKFRYHGIAGIIYQSEQTWGLTTPEKPVPAPMDMLSVYIVKQANSCFTRLASWPSIAETQAETREMKSLLSYSVVTTNT